jgi:hypothetical protein
MKRQIESLKLVISNLTSAPVTPSGFTRAIPELVRTIQLAEAKDNSLPSDWPMPMAAPITPKNSRAESRRRQKDLTRDAVRPGPLQIEDQTTLTAKRIADISDSRKSLLNTLLPVSEAVNEKVADAAFYRVRGLQEKLFPGPIEPETVSCKVQLRLRLGAEGKAAPRYACHFDRGKTFCRLVVLTLNLSDPIVCSRLKERKVGTLKFFAALALAKCLFYSRRNALVEALLTECKTLVGKAPNSRDDATAFANALAKGTLLEAVERLPIFGDAFGRATGRSFRLAEITLRIPTGVLGQPWDRE